MRGKPRADPPVPHPEPRSADRRLLKRQEMIPEHHTQTFRQRDKRCQVRVQKVRLAQPLALTCCEVADDAGKAQAAESLTANFLAQIEESAFATLRGRQP